MFNKILTLRNTLFTIFFMSVIKFSSLFKVSFILGSVKAFFSMTPMVQPLAGVWGGLTGTGLLFALGILLRIVFSGWKSFILLSYHVPGFFASCALASRHWVLHVVLPLICMALFIAHPVGMGAFAYTIYWLVPVALYVANKELFFLRALSSTFIAHGVGSVIWIWCSPMTSSAWLALIPVVFVERVIFALGMTLIYQAVCGVQKLVRTYTQSATSTVLE